MFELGSKVKDKLSGFTGVVMTVTEHLHGCRQYVVEPQETKDGKLLEQYYFQELRLELVEPSVLPAMTQKAPSRIKLGSHVRDNVTDFEGIAVTRSLHINGTVWIGIQPQKLHEGKVIDSHDFDEQRVEVIEEKAPVVSRQSVATTGGPQAAPTARATVMR